MKKINGVLTNVTEEDLKLLLENPEEFWKGVTEIGEKCFARLESLKEIVIPDSVEIIGESAFRECINLENIKLPKNLKDIGNACFLSCKNLKEIEIPDEIRAKTPT